MSTTTKHTPGPWTAGAKHPGRVFSNGRHVAFATMPDDEGTETEEEIANARLIAAAPEMLELLRECGEHLPEGSLLKIEAHKLIARVEAQS